MTGGFLSEPEPEHLAHSRISAQFAAQPALRDWASFMTEYSAPTAGRFAEATLKWGDTVRKDQTAYNIAFKTDMPFFEHIGLREETAGVFARYMRSLGQDEGLAMRHVLKGFDWAALGSGHVIDVSLVLSASFFVPFPPQPLLLPARSHVLPLGPSVNPLFLILPQYCASNWPTTHTHAHPIKVGGSTGETAILLAQNHPGLHITVQDLPATLSSRASPFEPPDSVSSRVIFPPHYFFTPQPPNTADVFFLRKILHDWPLTEAQQILGHIAAAMKPGALVVVMDTILPPPEKGPGGFVEAELRVRDLTMAQSFNGGEREMEDWVELIGGVRPRLRLRTWEQPKGSVMAMLVLERSKDT